MASILVRKFCQPVLDKAGYPMFHATVNDDRYHPNLVIYTTCGKPFVQVHGVRFSKRAPSVTECEYSGELLAQWMARHKQDFEEYVDAYTDFHSTTAPQGDVTYHNHSFRLANVDDTVLISIPHTITDEKGHPHSVKFNAVLNMNNGKIFDVEWGACSFTPKELAAKLTLGKGVLKAATKFFNDHIEYRTMKKRFEEIRQKITTCEI